MICFPNAKINLGLHIINKREDGFHNIETVFYPVGLSDGMECVENIRYRKQQKCVFVSSGLHIDGDVQHNLVVKAYQLLDKEFDLPPVLVFLNKVIPMGAGLGGGSSNAAYLLNLLNDLFGLKQTTAQLENYAAQLGSDCAFFVTNKPAYVFGKGHELSPIRINLSGYHLVMVHTGAHSSTALAYRNAKRRETYLPDHNLKHLVSAPVAGWKNTLHNDFETSVFEALPELSEVKKWLYDQGAVYASMSGSGACMFGIFDHDTELKGPWSRFVIHREKL